FFFSSRRRHTRFSRDWSSDVCSSDLNSLVPVLTYMGAFFATMVTGAVVIETVFGWPGIGRLAYEAIVDRDYPLMQGVVLVMTALFMLANLAVDLLHAWIDPRVRR